MEQLLLSFVEGHEAPRLNLAELQRLLGTHLVQDVPAGTNVVRHWLLTLDPKAMNVVGHLAPGQAMQLASQYPSNILVLVGTVDELAEIPSLTRYPARFGADEVVAVSKHKNGWTCQRYAAEI